MGTPATSEAIDRAARVMCARADARGLRADVERIIGRNRIEVRADGEPRRELEALAEQGRLSFYDWEPNVVGDPSVPFNDIESAVRAAARARPRAEAADIPPGGPSDEVESHLDGDRRRIREHYDGQNDTVGDRYFLLDERGELIRPPGIPAGNDANAFVTTLPTASASVRPVRVRRGVAIVKAEPPAEAAPSTPSQFFVIEDDAELSGADIVRPDQSFDPQTQEPIVVFEFSERGREAFARLSARVARRGQDTLPEPGQAPEDRFQRFAIALDGQLVSLAAIDFIENPEGISGDRGAQINGVGSIEDTRDLAETLRIGPLPVRLEPVR